MDERKWTFKNILKKISLLSLVVAFLFISYGSFVYLQIQTIKSPAKCFTTSMNKVRLCPSDANYVRHKQVPKIFFRALILSEDASFYSHSGFDWFEIKESFRRNLMEWRFARGGSTLTQQLAKNLYLTREKSLDRKFKEFFIAKQIEEHLNKSQILEKYINVVEFGKNIFGLKRAALHFFAKDPSQLTLLESVYLVSLLPSPKKYSRSFNNKKLSPINLRRMKIILGRLYRTKRISDEIYVYSTMLMEDNDWPFPHFSEYHFTDQDKINIEDELFLELEKTDHIDDSEGDNNTLLNDKTSNLNSDSDFEDSVEKQDLFTCTEEDCTNEQNALSTKPVKSCDNDEDCMLSCSLGSVNEQWYNRNKNESSECEDGCSGWGNYAACQENLCRTFKSDGSLHDSCQ